MTRITVFFVVFASLVTPLSKSSSQTILTKYSGNPVLGPGPASWDSRTVANPAVIYDGLEYKMWYSGTDGSVWYHAIGYATSSDGINWTKRQADPVLSPGSAGQWDSRYVTDHCVIYANGQYMMWYTGGDGSDRHKIGLATSTDGINWIKYSGNPVLEPEPGVPAPGWEYRHVYRPSVIYDGSTFKMWYNGNEDGGPSRIGYATSIDGVNWQKYPNNPVLKGDPTFQRSEYVSYPSVLWDGSQYVMFYAIATKTVNQSHLWVAFSNDGVSWQQVTDPVIAPGNMGEWDHQAELGSSSVLLLGDTYKVWYETAAVFPSTGWSSRIAYSEGPQDPFSLVLNGEIVNDIGNSGGASWGDYNSDGYLDLFVANDDGENNDLYENNGDGTFTKITSGDIVNNGGDSRMGTWGDYNNDGYPDIFVANGNGQNNFLYKNNGDGSFTKITTGAIVNDGGNCQGTCWGDYDSDGYLDLFVTNYRATNLLYRNNGDGTFTKITSGEIVNDWGYAGSASWADYDNDSDLDLFVANGDNQNNFLYANNGNGTFTKITNGDIVNDGGYNDSVSWGDYDNDGDLDVFIVNIFDDFLYQNNGDGTFTRVPNAAGIVSAEPGGNSSGWGDYDNDGYLDMFISGAITFLYKNNGDNTFTPMSLESLQYPVGASLGDYDNDGFLDLYVANVNVPAGQKNLLFNNNGNTNNWIDINPTTSFSIN